jgi:hypothetical protein
MKKIICFLCLSIFINLNFLTREVNANEFSGLEFTVDRVTTILNSKHIVIDVTNTSDNNYSYGWVGSCEVKVTTTEGTFYTSLFGSEKIPKGSSTKKVKINAPGEITSIEFSDIRLLNAQGLPKATGVNQYIKSSISVDIQSYTKLNLVYLILTLGGVGFLIVIYKVRKGSLLENNSLPTQTSIKTSVKEKLKNEMIVELLMSPIQLNSEHKPSFDFNDNNDTI